MPRKRTTKYYYRRRLALREKGYHSAEDLEMHEQKRIRNIVIEEANGICYWCHRPVDKTIENGPWYPTMDHLIPKSRGGRYELGNLVLAHKHCNQLRGNSMGV